MTSRRDFVRQGAAALLVGVAADGIRLIKAEAGVDFAPNDWIRIDRDGRVTISAHKMEMGQGVGTSLPLIIAEELGADWRMVSTVVPQPGRRFPSMRTAGSGSVAGSWRPLRQAAAAAREMLIAAAAGGWNVATAECEATEGTVVHRGSNRPIGFGELVAGAAALPVPSNPTLKSATAFRLLGRRVARLDTVAMVDGSLRYGFDVRLPGLLRAVVARSAAHGGRLAGWSADRARRIPGVRDVLEIPSGVAVVADSTWAAIRAREALDLTWDDSAATDIGSAELWLRLERALDAGGKIARKEGDVRQALAGAARRLEAEYRYPFQAHAAVEPLSCTAMVGDGRCELWAGTQAPNQAQEAIAALLGIMPERVTINPLPLGGGFGRRLAFDYMLESVEIARRIPGRPVQLIWTRDDDTRHDMYQSAQIVRMAAGLDPDGRIVGWRHRVSEFHLSMFGPHSVDFNPVEDGDPWGAFDTPYAFPALEVELARTASPVPTGAWRSVTYPPSVFARECFLDEVAHATGRDPLRLRLELLATPQSVRVGSQSLDNRSRLRAVLSLAADRAGWAQSHPRERNGRRYGRGLAANGYHEGTMVAQVAEVSVGPAGDLRVHKVVCAIDCGTVVNLTGVEQQFEGGVVWALSTLVGREITFTRGRTEQSGYRDFPVLRIADAPRVEVHVVPSSLRPFGIGEQPVPPVFPAVMNAVFAATGRRIRRVPFFSEQ